MSKFKLRRPTPALIISVMALFIALGSGAYAASKIGTNDIKNNAVTGKKIDKKAVKPSKLHRGAVKVNKIADQAVDTEKIAGLAVENDKLLSPTIWAYVKGTDKPSIERTNTDSETGAGATGVSREGTGHYKVTWAPQDPSLSGIDGCVALATPKSNSSEFRTVTTSIDDGSGPTFQTVVRTYDQTQTEADSDFTTALFC